VTSSPIVHSSLLSRLGRFYPTTATIQTYTTTQDTYGADVMAWANLAGHIDLTCWIAAAGGQELKRTDSTIAISTHRIALAGYYPAIEAQMRAVSGASTYDILAVAHDSQSKTTSLTCQIVA